MKKLLKSVVPPLLSLVIVMLGNGFFTTFVSLKFSESGYSNQLVGVLGAAYYLGMMLGASYVEPLIKRIGHIRSFALLASVNSAVIITQSFDVNLYLWTIYRILIGFCTSGFFIAIESWLLLSSSLKSRGRLLSLYMLTLYLAQGFGQFILNISGITTLLPYAITIILSSLSVIPVTLMKSSGPTNEESSVVGIFQTIKRAPLGPLGCFVSGIIMSSFYGLAPIFAHEISLSLFEISQFMGFTIIGGLLLQWPIGYLSDIFSRRKVIMGVGIALSAITFIIYQYHGIGFAPLMFFMIVFGGISFTLYPLSITYTCDHFSKNKTMGIVCSLLSVYGIGCIVGPLIAPRFMTIFGPGGLFVFMSILCSIYVLVCMWRVLHSKPLSEEDQVDYIPLPHAATIASFIDVRQGLESEEAIDEYEEGHDPLNLLFENEDEDLN